MKYGLLLLNLCLSMIGMGQIWLVQLSSYPLWSYVGPHEFNAYHIAWWHSIWGPIFIPAGLALVCTILLFWYRPAAVTRKSVWKAILLLFFGWGLTFIWWAPLMALIGATPVESQQIYRWAFLLDALRLEDKTTGELYQLLILTHWLRVVLFSAYGIQIFWQTIIASDPHNQGKQTIR